MAVKDKVSRTKRSKTFGYIWINAYAATGPPVAPTILIGAVCMSNPERFSAGISSKWTSDSKIILFLSR